MDSTLLPPKWTGEGSGCRRLSANNTKGRHHLPKSCAVFKKVYFWLPNDRFYFRPPFMNPFNSKAVKSCQPNLEYNLER